MGMCVRRNLSQACLLMGGLMPLSNGSGGTMEVASLRTSAGAECPHPVLRSLSDSPQLHEGEEKSSATFFRLQSCTTIMYNDLPTNQSKHLPATWETLLLPNYYSFTHAQPHTQGFEGNDVRKGKERRLYE